MTIRNHLSPDANTAGKKSPNFQLEGNFIVQVAARRVAATAVVWTTCTAATTVGITTMPRNVWRVIATAFTPTVKHGQRAVEAL
jgi:hypothetical protein